MNRPRHATATPTAPPVSAALGLFHVGVALALTHLAVSLELGVTLSQHGALVKSLVLFIFPLALAFLGIGGALEQARWPQSRPSRPMRVAGLALLLFVIVTLKVSFLAAPKATLWLPSILHLVTLGGWYLGLGAALAPLLREVRSAGTRWVGAAWAAHMLGLMLGYLVVDPLITHVGVNAILVATGASFLLLPRAGTLVLAAFLALSAATDLDWRIEEWRDLSALEAAQPEGLKDTKWGLSQHLTEALANPIHHGWSRHAQVRLVDGAEVGSSTSAFYNLRHQWKIQDGADRLHRLRQGVYAGLRPGAPTMIIGIGGGRGLQAFPFPLHKGVLAVERDGEVVRALRDLRPDLNDYLFQTVTVLAGDGRAHAERHPGGLDALVIESGRFQAATSLLPASSPMYLYTREALAMYLSRLGPDGLLLMDFSRVWSAHSAYVPTQVAETMRELQAQFTVMRDEKLGRVCIVACLSPGCLERRTAQALGFPGEEWDPTSFGPSSSYRLTDHTPFTAYATMLPAHRAILHGAVGATALLALLLVGLVARRSRPTSGPNPAHFFALIGAAHTAVHLASFYAYRSLFGDSILTITVVIVILAGHGAIGSALSTGLSARLLQPWARCLATTGLIALHLGLLATIPFEEPSLLLRTAYATLALAPGGILMGTFFPLGLVRTGHPMVGRALLADSIGVLAGYCLLYLVFLPWGWPAFAMVGAGLYIAAAAALPRPSIS